LEQQPIAVLIEARARDGRAEEAIAEYRAILERVRQEPACTYIVAHRYHWGR